MNIFKAETVYKYAPADWISSLAHAYFMEMDILGSVLLCISLYSNLIIVIC
jgi:hypothetical protein